MEGVSRMNTCKICNAETESFVQDIFRVTYHSCPSCEFIYKDEGDLVSEEAEFEIYETHENSIENEGYVSYLKRFLDHAVLPFKNGENKVLDFGSGPTPVLSMVMERDYGFKVDIYDLFYAPLKIYEGKTYDVVTSVEVVEHLAEPLVQFEILKNILKDDGILAIQTQFHPRDMDEFRKWHYMRDRSHIAFYTRKTMEKIAEIMELDLIYCDVVRYTTFRRK